MMIRATCRRRHSITAAVFLFFFFCCIAPIHAQLRNNKKVSAPHNDHYQRRSPDKVKGRQPKEEERTIATTRSVHASHKKEVHTKMDVGGLESHRNARDYEHRHLTMSTKESHKQKKNVRVGSYYYKRIEHTGPETESDQDEHVYYMPNKARSSNKSSKSNKSKKSPMAEINMEKRIIPYRHSRQGPTRPSDKSGKSSKELEIESDKVKHVYIEPYIHYSHEPATDIQRDRENRFYKSNRYSSHAPVSSPGITTIESKLGPEVDSDMERRFYPRGRQQRINDEAPNVSNGLSETNRVYMPFTDKIFGNGPANNTTPMTGPEIESDMERRFYPRVRQQRIDHEPVVLSQKASNGPETNRVYTPFGDRIFGHEPAINKVHEVLSETDISDDKPLGHEEEEVLWNEFTAGTDINDKSLGHEEEEEVQGNEFTQLDEIPESFPCFTNRMDLVAAVDEYLFDNGRDTDVAQTYGWPIGTWCVSQVKSFSAVFSANRNPAASTFDEDLSNWDVSNATSTQNMFEGSAIDQDFSTWNTSAVKSMNSMFSHTPSFQGKGLSKWDTSSVTDMSFMFSNAISLREDISAWNVSSVKSTWGMFQFASSFNHDLSPWRLRRLVSMDLMFNSATSFRHDLCNWIEHVPKDLVNTYGVFTMSNCPNGSDPDLSAYSPGPFCFDC